jgi:hypothetical protein
METGLARCRSPGNWIAARAGSPKDRHGQRPAGSEILPFAPSAFSGFADSILSHSLIPSPYSVFVTLLNIRGLSVLRPLALVRW